MADRMTLTNDTVTGPLGSGLAADEEIFVGGLANWASAHTGSATQIPLFIAKDNGRITDFWFKIGGPAVSAANFPAQNTSVYGISATVRINSVAAMSTNPGITGVAVSASSIYAWTTRTSTAEITAGVVNAASAAFSAGDIVTLDYNIVSSGTAAAGKAGTGFMAVCVVRYAAK